MRGSGTERASTRLLMQDGNRGMGKFQKGQSGNPAGRKSGSRHKASLAVEALLDDEAEKLSRKAIEMALDGNAVALRLCLERIAPPRRGRRPVNLDLGPVKTSADLADAQNTSQTHPDASSPEADSSPYSPRAR